LATGLRDRRRRGGRDALAPRRRAAEAAIAPISSSSGSRSPRRVPGDAAALRAAVALTFVPVAAAVVLIESGSLFSALGTSPAASRGAALGYQALLVLGNGFILTAVLWGWALAAIIDHRLVLAGLLFVVASPRHARRRDHSPLASGALFWPWAAPSPMPGRLAGAYGGLATLCWLAAMRARRISA